MSSVKNNETLTNNNKSSNDFSNPIVTYLTITTSVADHISQLISQRNEPCQGIRINVRTRGCSGMSYTIEYALAEKNITKFDDLVLCQNSQGQTIQVFIDPKASMFLINSEMIFKSDELTSGFDFINPNEKGRCGCGESFKV